jgi:hypothetical protein
MSSMAEGSEGWAREDELDLGQDEHDLQNPGHDGALDHDYPGPSPQKPELVEAEAEELDTIDNAQDEASEKTLEANGPQLPQTPPLRQAPMNATPGSVDETASTPDDTPSIHVSGCDLGIWVRFVWMGVLLMTLGFYSVFPEQQCIGSSELTTSQPQPSPPSI